MNEPEREERSEQRERRGEKVKMLEIFEWSVKDERRLLVGQRAAVQCVGVAACVRI